MLTRLDSHVFTQVRYDDIEVIIDNDEYISTDMFKAFQNDKYGAESSQVLINNVIFHAENDTNYGIFKMPKNALKSHTMMSSNVYGGTYIHKLTMITVCEFLYIKGVWLDLKFKMNKIITLSEYLTKCGMNNFKFETILYHRGEQNAINVDKTANKIADKTADKTDDKTIISNLEKELKKTQQQLTDRDEIIDQLKYDAYVKGIELDAKKAQIQKLNEACKTTYMILSGTVEKSGV
jgi:hypothetical protein